MLKVASPFPFELETPKSRLPFCTGMPNRGRVRNPNNRFASGPVNNSNHTRLSMSRSFPACPSFCGGNDCIQICNIFFGRSIRNSLPRPSCWQQHSCAPLLFSLVLCKTTLHSAWGILVRMRSHRLRRIAGLRARRSHTLRPPSPKCFTQVSIELSTSNYITN